ncbi:Protein of unknown function [Zhouia amylolytica]|uniref:Heme oxygenase n=2 Tax=Zhouia amylolytica TaxID=376730 RepID=W2UIP9_9FLAO|nr:DUF3050 domain-containing protein [Zhouia amylolytica]ETN93799.1 protein of unknown function (DUF3050) [Zhouia amylolytica AD3]MCQ0111754.1 DUF3050 domain-containing protein [Zhouia amylolytica]SFS35230.1 Protein of unknown function [Zhouia amylolytica]
MIEKVFEAIKEERSSLLEHPLYKDIKTPEELNIFLQHHVFAVWDFMSLLKALQNSLTCTQSPWVPVGNPQTRYLINEIVLAEETDINAEGLRQSHFEMYIEAMKSFGASTVAIKNLLASLSSNNDIISAIASSSLPEGVKQFLNFTFEIIADAKPHKIAAAFTFGREELIPDMFTSILKNMELNFPEKDLSKLIYYFERHIELDGDEHGPMAMKMVEELCDTEEKYLECIAVAKEALEKRILLWDGILAEIKTKTLTV